MEQKKPNSIIIVLLTVIALCLFCLTIFVGLYYNAFTKTKFSEPASSESKTKFSEQNYLEWALKNSYTHDGARNALLWEIAKRLET